MEDGLRVAISGQRVEIFQNAGDPDCPEDEISISMSIETFRRIVAISETALGIKKASRPAKVSEEFHKFWDAYPRKTARDKAERAWVAADADEHADAIMTALEAAISCDQWTKDSGRFIPHPATWLNQKRWNDVVETDVLGQFK